jgi:hypothetical protein
MFPVQTATSPPQGQREFIKFSGMFIDGLPILFLEYLFQPIRCLQLVDDIFLQYFDHRK